MKIKQLSLGLSLGAILFAGAFIFSACGSGENTPTQSSSYNPGPSSIELASSSVISSSSIDPGYTLEKIDVPQIDNPVYKYGKRYYSLFTEKKNWIDAELYCESIGGNLAVIRDAKEQKVVEELYEAVGIEKSPTWIGLIRKENGGITTENKPFSWVNGDSNYTNWASNNPSDIGTENAVLWTSRDGRWANDGYKFHYNYVCEWADDQSFGVKKHSYLPNVITNQEQLLKALKAESGSYYINNDIYLDNDFTYIDKVSSTINGGGHIISIPNKNIDADNKYNFIKELTGKLDNIVFEIDISTSATFDGLGGVVDTNNGSNTKLADNSRG